MPIRMREYSLLSTYTLVYSALSRALAISLGLLWRAERATCMGSYFGKPERPTVHILYVPTRVLPRVFSASRFREKG